MTSTGHKIKSYRLLSNYHVSGPESDTFGMLAFTTT